MNDPDTVAAEYLSEARLLRRKGIYRSMAASGRDAYEVIFELIRSLVPQRILEVGCGVGDFAQLLASLPDVEMVAVDRSPRMVRLTAERGVDARQACVTDLPFPGGSFDVAVANWMLYHVHDIPAAIAELARVVGPCGTLIATTKSADHLRELWDLAGHPGNDLLPFRSENAPHLLAAAFKHVEEIRVEGTVTFPTAESVYTYIGAAMAWSDALLKLSDWRGPVTARRIVSIFVCHHQPLRRFHLECQDAGQKAEPGGGDLAL